MMCIHRLEGTVRVDDAAWASASEFTVRGARGKIAADDALAEIAYKLGRAGKFGA
jgi:hypothetical protein